MEINRSGCCGNPSSETDTTPQPAKRSCCGGAPRLVFACSGASDVGVVADQAARRVSRMKLASMGCLAAVANGLEFAMEPIKVAERIIVIDGCPESCARLTMEKAGALSFDHILLSDLNMEKEHTKVNQENMVRVYERAVTILDNGN